jgi:hypothetical protein
MVFIQVINKIEDFERTKTQIIKIKNNSTYSMLSTSQTTSANFSSQNAYFNYICS